MKFSVQIDVIHMKTFQRGKTKLLYTHKFSLFFVTWYDINVN